MRRKILVSLPRDAYIALEMRAAEEERAVDQQASFILKRAVLSDRAPHQPPVGLSVEAPQ